METLKNGYEFTNTHGQSCKVIYFSEMYKMYWVETLVVGTSMYYTGSWMDDEYINKIKK